MEAPGVFFREETGKTSNHGKSNKRNARAEIPSHRERGEEDATELLPDENDPRHVNKLPNEILAHIFSFVDYRHRIRSERTCKRWRQVNAGVSIWSRFEMKVKSKAEKPSFCRFVECHGSKLKSLQIAKSDFFCQLEIERMLRYCGNVVRVLLKERGFHPRRFGRIMEHLPKTKDLTVESSAVTKRPGQNARSRSRIRSAGKVAAWPRRLEKLELFGLYDEFELVLPAGGTAHLRSLDLYDVRWTITPLECSHLEELTLKFCPQLSSDDVASLLRNNARTLKSIDLFDVTLNVACIVSALRSCTELETVSLEDELACDAVLEAITDACSEKLRVLFLSWGEVSKEGLEFLKRCSEPCRIYIHNGGGIRKEPEKCMRYSISWEPGCKTSWTSQLTTITSQYAQAHSHASLATFDYCRGDSHDVVIVRLFV